MFKMAFICVRADQGVFGECLRGQSIHAGAGLEPSCNLGKSSEQSLVITLYIIQCLKWSQCVKYIEILFLGYEIFTIYL